MKQLGVAVQPCLLIEAGKGRFLFYFAENAPVVFDQLVERKITTIVRDYSNYPPAPAASEILSRTRHTPQAYPTVPRVTITHQSNKSKTDCMNKIKQLKHYSAFTSYTVVVVLIAIGAVVFTPVTLWKIFILGTCRHIRQGNASNCTRVAFGLRRQLGRTLKLRKLLQSANKGA